MTTRTRWPTPIPRPPMKSREQSRERLAEAYAKGGHPRGLPIVDVGRLLRKLGGEK